MLREQEILDAIAKAQKWGGRAFPSTVQPWLDFYRHEATLRRDMARLAEQGKLIRLGDRKEGGRKGYVLPTPVNHRLAGQAQRLH